VIKVKEFAMKVGVVYDPVYLEHDTGEHLENADRVDKISAYLEETRIIPQLVPISPRPATEGELTLIHQAKHVAYVQSFCRNGGGLIDSDTMVSRGSYEAALYAAGGAIKAGEAVMDGTVDSAFALVRPPGHHATFNQAMGFCLFNNIAVASKYILSKYGLDRIAIIDFDVHHGNGTQSAFYDDPRVLYISIHEHPLFPGTGDVQEAGSKEALGTTVNIPLPASCGDEEYEAAFEQIVMPVTRRYQPQLIMVSAGYDSHWADDISLMQVSVRGFSRIVQNIKKLAGEVCDQRLAMVLEGGYHPGSLTASVKATFEVLLGHKEIEDPLGPSPYRIHPPDIAPLIRRIKETHGLG
jgi:acetoin utilization deacetylase AcuC-like enzyme